MTKSYKSSSSVMIQLLLVGLFLSVSVLSTNYFKSYADIKKSFSYYPTAIRISSDEKEVAVGFTNGTLTIFDMQGYSKYYLSGCHNYYMIKDIKEVRGNGWVSLDTSDRACRWSSTGSYLFSWNFTNTVVDMSLTFLTYGYAYIGFNFGNMTMEYYSETYSTVPRKIYYPLSTTTFSRIQYDGYGSRLFAATSTGYIHSFNCSTGNYSSSVMSTSYTVKAFNTLSNGEIIFTDGTKFYKLNTSLNYNSFYTYGNMNIVAASYKNSEYSFIMTSANSSYTLSNYDSSGYTKQSLIYGSANYRALDASTNYLVVADNSGYLYFATYRTDQIIINVDFPVWAIIISIVVPLLCIVGIVLIVIRLRKRRLAIAANGYNRFNDPQQTQQYFPNNQPYNPVNPPNYQPNQVWNPNQQNQQWNPNQQWNQNQGWNQSPNQGWNQTQTQTQQPQTQGQLPSEPVVVVQPTNPNPYQANQPSNWS